MAKREKSTLFAILEGVISLYQVLIFCSLNIDNIPLGPEAELREAIIDGINSDVDPLREDMIDLHGKVIDGYLPVRVHGPVEPQAEYISLTDR